MAPISTGSKYFCYGFLIILPRIYYYSRHSSLNTHSKIFLLKVKHEINKWAPCRVNMRDPYRSSLVFSYWYLQWWWNTAYSKLWVHFQYLNRVSTLRFRVCRGLRKYGLFFHIFSNDIRDSTFAARVFLNISVREGNYDHTWCRFNYYIEINEANIGGSYQNSQSVSSACALLTGSKLL